MSSKAIAVSYNSRRAHVVIGVLAILIIASLTPAMAGDGWKDDVSSADAVTEEYVPGELLVKFCDDATDDEKKDARSAIKVKGLKTFKSVGAEHIKLGKDMDVEKALKVLGKKKYEDVVEYAEPNYWCYIDGYPTDTYRGDLWHFHNLGQTGGSIDADIDMLEGWDQLTLTNDAVVAVLDTGIDITHPDLDGVIWTNPGETLNGVDDDGNGYIDDVHGWDFIGDDNYPLDDHGHGSHCSGVIAAEHDGSGVAGMASSHVKIVPVKWLNSGGRGSINDAILSVEYAASLKDGSGDNYVRITSNSWGISKKSVTLQKAIASSGALFVASAGNSGRTKVQYPAGYPEDNIIAVAATDHNDALASFSNYGDSWVDIGAPGVSVFSCDMAGGYTLMSGTSMSAPQVAGAAALEWAVNGWTSIADTKAAILDNAEYESSLDGLVATDGKLDIVNMFGLTEITADADAPGKISLSSSGSTMRSVTLSWTAVDEDGGSSGPAYLYDLRYSSGTFSWSSATKASGEPIPAAAGTIETFEVMGLQPGTTYTFAIKAVDEGGNAGAESDLLSVTTGTPNWDIENVLSPSATIYYQSVALDDSGEAAFSYSLEGGTYFVSFDGTNWVTETIETGKGLGGGTDLAWDGSNWWIVCGGSAAKVAKRNGANDYTITTIEPRKVHQDWKTIEVSADGVIGISYWLTGRNGGLKYAEYDGSSWNDEVVDKGAAPRYSDLEYDSNGEPCIAYSDSSDGQWLDIQKYAKRSDTDWTIESPLTGVVGYGVQTDLELDGSDQPHIVCSGVGIDYLFKDSSGWHHAIADSYQYSGQPTLALVGSDVYIAFNGEFGTTATRWDGSSWTQEAIEAVRGGGFRSCLEYDVTDTLHLGYYHSGYLKHATRDIVNGPSWG